MRRCPPLRLLPGLLFLTVSVTRADPVASNQLSRATSASHQFVAYASGPLLPQAVCVFADQVRREWQYWLRLNEEGRDPIIILVRDRLATEAGAPSPVVSVFQTELHLKYQVTWLTPPPLEQRGLVRAVVEALCDELANRHQPVAPVKSYVPAPIPPWLSAGLARAIRGRDERLLQVARRSVAGGRPLSADSLLTVAELPADPIGLDLFDITAGLFTEGLLGLPHGPERLAGFITTLGQTKNAAPAFDQVYAAEFPDRVALEKWWALELSRRTALLAPQDLTATETRRRLATILATDLAVADTNQQLVAETSLPFGELWRHYDQPWMGRTIADKRIKLEGLLRQAAPNYRGVISAYQLALEWLRQGKINRFRRAARAAANQQQAVDRRDGAISAYLDQMELVHSPLLTGEDFDAFFRTFESLEQLEQHRRNPISDYLDQFER